MFADRIENSDQIKGFRLLQLRDIKPLELDIWRTPIPYAFSRDLNGGSAVTDSSRG